MAEKPPPPRVSGKTASGNGKLPEDPDCLPEIDSPRPKVQLPGNNRLLSDFASELGELLKEKGLYQRGGYVVVVKQQLDKKLNVFVPVLEAVTSQSLRTLVEKHLICWRLHESVRGKAIRFDQTMTDQDAKGVLASTQFLDRLPPIDRFATVRLPVMRADETIDQLPNGYDKDSATLTINNCDYSIELSFDEAKAVIDELLVEFSFAEDGGRSRAVMVAAMVGQFVDALIPRGALRPIPTYLANAEGAGKTLSAKCAILPVHGSVAVEGGLKDGAETDKVILASVIAGQSYILFDNCKGYLSSPTLEAFVSAAHWEGRILGQSKKARGENNITVFITGNNCTLSPDLRRRGLFVELTMPAEFPEDRTFEHTLDDHELLKMRPRILGALWAFLREWCEAGRPSPSRAHSSFPRWAEIVGGIVEFAGYGCPLMRAEIEGMVDTDGADMRKLVQAMHDLEADPQAFAEQHELPQALNGRGDDHGKGYSFEQLVTLCRDLGLFDALMSDVDNLDNLKRAARTTFGYILKRYRGRQVGGLQPLRFMVKGEGHSKRFFAVDQTHVGNGA